MSLKFQFVHIAENNVSEGLPPVRISPHKDFPFGVKRFCPGHNKIDMSVILCGNLQSVDNIEYVDGREMVDKLVFF